MKWYILFSLCLTVATSAPSHSSRSDSRSFRDRNDQFVAPLNTGPLSSKHDDVTLWRVDSSKDHDQNPGIILPGPLIKRQDDVDNIRNLHSRAESSSRLRSKLRDEERRLSSSSRRSKRFRHVQQSHFQDSLCRNDCKKCTTLPNINFRRHHSLRADKRSDRRDNRRDDRRELRHDNRSDGRRDNRRDDRRSSRSHDGYDSKPHSHRQHRSAQDDRRRADEDVTSEFVRRRADEDVTIELANLRSNDRADGDVTSKWIRRSDRADEDVTSELGRRSDRADEDVTSELGRRKADEDVTSELVRRHDRAGEDLTKELVRDRRRRDFDVTSESDRQRDRRDGDVNLTAESHRSSHRRDLDVTSEVD